MNAKSIRGVASRLKQGAKCVNCKAILNREDMSHASKERL